MKTKTLIPLIMGVVVGGIAIKIVVDVVSNADAATRANKTQVVVAKMDIAFAEEITPDKLELRDWPKDSLPAQHFKSIEELGGRVSEILIPKDVPIYPTMLAPPGTPPGLQTRIEKGYLAMSIPIDEVTGVAYQLKPGDCVDVVSLVKKRMGDRRRVESISRIILQNVEIAAVGRTLQPAKDGKKSKSVARSATLLLKPAQATRLHLAQSLGGKISLALRGSTNVDMADEEDSSTSSDQLAGQEVEDVVVPEPALASFVPKANRRPVGETCRVKVVRGNTIQWMIYRQVNGRWEEDANNSEAGSGDFESSGDHDFELDADDDYGRES